MLTKYKVQTFELFRGQDGVSLDIEIAPPDDAGRQRMVINVRTPTGRIRAAVDIETLLAPDIVVSASPLDLKKVKA